MLQRISLSEDNVIFANVQVDREPASYAGRVFAPDLDELVIPQPLFQANPDYPGEALAAAVEGEVWLEIVVLPDGTVGPVRVSKWLDPIFGLDGEAVVAARKWRFSPGTFRGEPVAVWVPIAIEFHLR